MILGFIIAHLTMLGVILGYAIPRYYDALIPMERRGEGTEPRVAMETKNELGGRPIANMAERGEAPPEYESDEDRARVKVAK
jgi:solute carrier family 6 GABA transporter-like protein 1